ncbi:uncharacterized protein LOC131599168 [Vicia villosa]|uniref:uncharacterized protein LOC131599168 n=1 Tax=Vicia villosa TaxID=3911 RepID=UPI00273B81E4|nr:uncharacterized protein LOC131599168 [Vicia villosa]
MSQSTPSKQLSPSSEKASESRAPNVVIDQDVVLNVAPLNAVPASDPVRSQPRKMHARKSTGGSVPETFSVQGREGSSYVHNVIANIVTRILNEGHKVDGISVPLAQMPASENIQDDQGEQDDASKDQDNVETSADKNDETPVAKDVETSIPAVPAEKDASPNVHDVVDLDDLDDPIDIADDDLISSISNRVKARKGKQVGEQYPLKPQVTPLKTVTKEKMKKVPSGPSKSGSKEFIVNLSQDCADGRTDDFHKVYVRRKCIEFSPTAINHYLGRNAEAQPEFEVTDNEVCKTITGGKVKKWPIKSKLSASLLTVKYALLHKIGAANWVPTNHTSTIAVGLGRFIYAIGTKTVFDYGTYIFDQTMRHAGTSATKLPIAFPSLICGIILKQYPGILKAKDSSADSGDDHAAGGDGEKMDADSDDEYKAEDDEDADAQTSSSSDVEMSEEDDEDTAFT